MQTSSSAVSYHSITDTPHRCSRAARSSVEEGLRYTQALNSALLQSDDMPVAMLAVMQKKTPKFAKL